MQIPANEQEMTRTWLASCLNCDAALIESVQVHLPDKQSGLFGAIAFIDIVAAPDSGLPAKLVCKYVPPDPATAAAVKEYEVFAREENFYRNFAPNISIRTPRCLASKYDAALGAGFLLLEDCSNFEERNLVDEIPSSLEELELVITTAARLCSSSWDQPWLVDDPLTLRPGQHVWEGYFGNMQAGWAPYLEHGLGQLAMPGFQEVATELAQSYRDRLAACWPENRLSFSHMDFHCANYFFDPSLPDDPIVVFDFQAGTIGRTAHDLGCILAVSFPPEFRREHERRLVTLFYDALAPEHASQYTEAECWADYEQGLLIALRLVPQFVTELDLTSEYGAAVGAKVVRNLSAAVMDLGGMKFLDRTAG